MLYDYNCYDSTAKTYVYDMVENDVTTLSQNGFNLVHLYLWDTDLLVQVSKGAPGGPEPAGFIDASGNPALSSGNPACPNYTDSQWTNLNDFVTRAENHGIFVALHFASGWLANQPSFTPSATPSVVAGLADTYAAWENQFVVYLNTTNKHKNVLEWGLGYTVTPAPGSLTNPYSEFAQEAYYMLDGYARSASPSPGVLGLIGVDITFQGVNDHTTEVARGSGYTWTWQTAVQDACTMRLLLSGYRGFLGTGTKYQHRRTRIFTTFRCMTPTLMTFRAL